MKVIIDALHDVATMEDCEDMTSVRPHFRACSRLGNTPFVHEICD